MTTEPALTIYSRLSPAASLRLHSRTGEATPTKTQTAVELTLFSVFALTMIISAIALVMLNTRAFHEVPNRVPAGIASGRVNLLFISMTDTPRGQTKRDVAAVNAITLLSLNPADRQAALISIPPQLWVKVGRFGTHRLAAADSIGISSGYPGEGTGLMSDTVEAVTGQPVHAVVRFDDETLAPLVDSLGGVDVNVRRNFYEWRHKKRFRIGLQHLNGQRAVWFASPYAAGREGGPGACELRQQQLLLAIVEKLKSAPPAVRSRFAKLHHSHDGTLTASTNLTPADLDQLLPVIGTAASVRVVNFAAVLQPFEVQTLNDAGQALRPRGDDYSVVRDLIRGAINSDTAAVVVRSGAR